MDQKPKELVADERDMPILITSNSYWSCWWSWASQPFNGEARWERSISSFTRFICRCLFCGRLFAKCIQSPNNTSACCRDWSCRISYSRRSIPCSTITCKAWIGSISRTFTPIGSCGSCSAWSCGKCFCRTCWCSNTSSSSVSWCPSCSGTRSMSTITRAFRARCTSCPFSHRICFKGNGWMPSRPGHFNCYRSSCSPPDSSCCTLYRRSCQLTGSTGRCLTWSLAWTRGMQALPYDHLRVHRHHGTMRPLPHSEIGYALHGPWGEYHARLLLHGFIVKTMRIWLVRSVPVHGGKLRWFCSAQS